MVTCHVEINDFLFLLGCYAELNTMYDECVQIFVVTVYLECVPLAGLAGGRRGTRGEARRGAGEGEGGDRQEGPTMAN